MTDNTKHNIPQLRFPGFTGEWEEKKLGEVCKIITPTLKLQSSEYHKQGKYPIVDQSQTKICGWTNDDEGLICDTPVIIFGDHTCVLKYIDFPFIQGADGIKILSPYDSYHPQFVFQTFLSNPIIQDGYKRHFSDFKEKLYMFPSSPIEQQKIADCLSSLDDMINTEGQKTEALREYKRGLMQQLFPANGATTPQLRFPGFTGEWKEKKLGEVCENILVGFPFKGEDIIDDSSGQPILRAYCIGDGIIKHGKDYDKFYPHNSTILDKYRVREGDIVISMDGSVGKNIALVSEKEKDYLLIQRVARLRIQKHPIQLVYQQVKSQRFKDFANSEKVGAVIAHISQKQIEAFPILLPPSPSEQQKIADCLSSLDDMITAQAGKTETLREYKRGLMQQLFPQPSK